MEIKETSKSRASPSGCCLASGPVVPTPTHMSFTPATWSHSKSPTQVPQWSSVSVPCHLLQRCVLQSPAGCCLLRKLRPASSTGWSVTVICSSSPSQTRSFPETRAGSHLSRVSRAWHLTFGILDLPAHGSAIPKGWNHHPKRTLGSHTLQGPQPVCSNLSTQGGRGLGDVAA